MAKLSSTHIFGNLVVDGNINGNADTASKVNNGIKIQLNGGTAENTSQFTFDGSITKNINITPSSIGAATTSTVTTSANGLMSSTDKSKLDGIAANANNYSHPTYTSKTSGLYKVTVDNTGHVSATTAVTKADITGLGIPGSDTTYSVATTSANGLMSSTDKSKLDGIAANANNYSHPTTSGNKHIPSGGSSGQILRWSADGTAVWGNDNNTTYSTGTASASGLTKLYAGTGTATDGTMTQAAIKTALDGKAASSHTHGLLHDNFTAELANTTTDSGWSMINSNYSGHLLKSLRTNASAPAWILNDYSAGIAFGGADTKGVMSMAYKSPSVRFAGGNGTKPVWYFTLSGTSAKVYNMDSLAANTANTLATTRTINGTNFNGSTNITTANWGTARNISIADNDGTNTGTAVSVNGSANATLKLPAIIKATLTGNATTATILQTTRSINGTNFNGSSNITTANWGTSRNITVGNTAKSVNGSANVSWSLSEIGALPTNGGTMTGNIAFSNTGATSGTVRGITATTGDNDGWRIVGGQTATNAGYLEIATMDDNSEPIYVRQYTGAYATLGRTATLLGSDGSTSFPVKVTSPSFVGALTGNASTATKATQDSAGQQINTTYIKGLSVSGKTITYTKGDGTTGTITTQDTNTTYSTGTTSASGLTKLYTGTGTATDGTMTQAALKTALDGKANSSHTHTTINSNFTVTDQLFKYKGITPSAASSAAMGGGGYDYVQGCNISIGANPDISSGIYGACLIGYDNVTQVGDTFIMGARNESYDTRNYIFGCDNIAETYDNFIIGNFNTVNSDSVSDCYIFGSGNTLNGIGVAIGRSNNVDGYNGAAIGYNAKVLDDGGYAIGYYARAHAYQLGIGHFGNVSSGAKSWGTEGTAFVIGNGGGDSSCSNACRITYAGAVIGKAAYASSGADYAEYFEWLDGNPNNEDRVGYFVTMEGDKIKIAKEGDYLLGVVSGYPAVIGNNDMEWQGQFLTDDFGRPIKEKLTKSVHKDPEDENSEIEIKEYEYFALNPNYNPNEKYIHREDRPEWDTVGMLGVLSVYDDGTCKVNGYCKCNNEGIATTCERGFDTYRVIKRVNDRIVKIIFNIK